jgi:hypothetical protein
MPLTLVRRIADRAQRVTTRRETPRLNLPQSVTALHLGSDDVRFLTARQGRVIEWGSEPLPPGLVSDGAIANTEVAGACIEKLLSGRRSIGSRLVVGLGAQHSMPRILEFPPLAGKLLEEAVRREMKRDAPMQPDEMQLAWQVLQSDEKQTRIFALAVPRRAIDQVIDAFLAANRKPQSIDSKPLALVRAVGRTDALIADLEPDSIDVIIVRRCVPVTTRTVGLRPDASPDDKVRRLGEELTRTAKFYADNNRDDPLRFSTPVFLTGSLAPHVAAAGIVEASVAYPVEPLEPAMVCPPELPLATYMMNIGLALKEK